MTDCLSAPSGLTFTSAGVSDTPPPDSFAVYITCCPAGLVYVSPSDDVPPGFDWSHYTYLGYVSSIDPNQQESASEEQAESWAKCIGISWLDIFCAGCECCMGYTCCVQATITGPARYTNSVGQTFNIPLGTYILGPDANVNVLPHAFLQPYGVPPYIDWSCGNLLVGQLPGQWIPANNVFGGPQTWVTGLDYYWQAPHDSQVSPVKMHVAPTRCPLGFPQCPSYPLTPTLKGTFTGIGSFACLNGVTITLSLANWTDVAIPGRVVNDCDTTYSGTVSVCGSTLTLYLDFPNLVSQTGPITVFYLYGVTADGLVVLKTIQCNTDSAQVVACNPFLATANGRDGPCNIANSWQLVLTE
jgi:hypothetical protein